MEERSVAVKERLVTVKERLVMVEEWWAKVVEMLAIAKCRVLTWVRRMYDKTPTAAARADITKEEMTQQGEHFRLLFSVSFVTVVGSLEMFC